MNSIEQTEAQYKEQIEALETEHKEKMNAYENTLDANVKSGLVSKDYAKAELLKLEESYQTKIAALRQEWANVKQYYANLIHSGQTAAAAGGGTIPSSTLFPNLVTAGAGADSGVGKYALLALVTGVGLFLWWRKRK